MLSPRSLLCECICGVHARVGHLCVLTCICRTKVDPKYLSQSLSALVIEVEPLT